MGLTTTTKANNESTVDELERTINNTEDDDDEDDEDYNPTNNDDGDDDGDGDDTAATIGDGDNSTTIENNKRSRLSPAKQCAVDEAFASLFGNGVVATTTTKTTTNNRNKRSTTSSSSPSSKKKQRQKNILQDIFGGSSIASKLMATSHRSAQGYDRSSSRKRSMSISNFAEEKVLVRETKRFAGRDIEVVRTAVVVRGDGNDAVGGGVTLKKNGGEHSTTASIPTAGSSSNNNNNTKPQGIDSLLSQIKGPQKISTMTKTDADWEVFKDHAGLEEELKKKAEGKDAFLVKKDFLDRVDVRKFEKEKEGRERERAVTAAAAVGRL